MKTIKEKKKSPSRLGFSFPASIVPTRSTRVLFFRRKMMNLFVNKECWVRLLFSTPSNRSRGKLKWLFLKNIDLFFFLVFAAFQLLRGSYFFFNLSSINIG